MKEEYDFLIIKKLIDNMRDCGIVSGESYKLLINKLVEKSNSETIRFLLENSLTS